MDVFAWIWIAFLAMSLLPILRQQRLDMARERILRHVSTQRGSRVITLIHRQESVSFLGIPVARYINIEDSEQILRAIRATPDQVPIDLLLHTPGGLVLASEQIAQALARHPARVTVFIPHYAMSGGTLIALAADQIVIDENAVLGPVDPQIGSYPAASILKAVERKGVERVEDETLILADVAEKALDQVHRTVFDLLRRHRTEEEARELATLLTQGTWTHDYPIDCSQLRTMGLPVSCDMPDIFYRLMDLYPQPPSRRPSVQYVPLPNGTASSRRTRR